MTNKQTKKTDEFAKYVYIADEARFNLYKDGKLVEHNRPLHIAGFDSVRWNRPNEYSIEYVDEHTSDSNESDSDSKETKRSNKENSGHGKFEVYRILKKSFLLALNLIENTKVLSLMDFFRNDRVKMLFQKLDKDELKYLCEYVDVKLFFHGQVILNKGDVITHVHFVRYVCP